MEFIIFAFVSFAGSPSPSSRLTHCPSAVGSPRKEVVCYFQGKRAASTVDACLCTHIVYTDVGLDHESRISIADGKTVERRIMDQQLTVPNRFCIHPRQIDIASAAPGYRYKGCGLGYVDLDLKCSAMCSILPGPMAISGLSASPGGTPKSKSTLPGSSSKWGALYSDSFEDR